jgi:hypothetical protein
MSQKRNYRTVAIPIETHRRLRRYGVEHDVAITAMMAEAIEEWLEKRSLVPWSGGAVGADESVLEVGSGGREADAGRTCVESVDGLPTRPMRPEGAELDADELGETF